VDASGVLVAQTLANRSGFIVDASGNTTVRSVKNLSGFTVDASGFLVAQTLANKTGFTVDASGNTAVRTVNNLSGFAVDSSGVLVAQTLANKTGFTVDAVGNTAVRTVNNLSGFTVDTSGVLVAQTLANRSGFIVDASGNTTVRSVTNRSGFAVDSSGVLVAQTLKNLSGFIVDASGNTTVRSVTNLSGFAVDSSGVLVAQTLKNLSGFTVDAAGVLVAQTLANQNKSFYADASGYVTLNNLIIAGYPLSYYLQTATANNYDISGDLRVTGISYLNGGLNVQNGAVLVDSAGNLDISGNLIIAGKPLSYYLQSSVISSYDISGYLTVAGLSSLNGGLSIGSGLTVDAAGSLVATTLANKSGFTVDATGNTTVRSLTVNNCTIDPSGNIQLTGSTGIFLNGVPFSPGLSTDPFGNLDISGTMTSRGFNNTDSTFNVDAAGVLVAQTLANQSGFIVDASGNTSVRSITNLSGFTVDASGVLVAQTLKNLSGFIVDASGNTAVRTVNNLSGFTVDASGVLVAQTLKNLSGFTVDASGNTSVRTLANQNSTFNVDSLGNILMHNTVDFGIGLYRDTQTVPNTLNVRIGNPSTTGIILSNRFDGGVITIGGQTISAPLSNPGTIFVNRRPIIGPTGSLSTNLTASGISTFNGPVITRDTLDISGAFNIRTSSGVSASFTPSTKTFGINDNLVVSSGGSFTAISNNPAKRSSITLGYATGLQLKNPIAQNMVCTDDTAGAVSLAVTQNSTAPFLPIMTVGNMNTVSGNTVGNAVVIEGGVYIDGDVTYTGKLSGSTASIASSLTAASVGPINLISALYGISVQSQNILNPSPPIPNTSKILAQTASLQDVINAVNILIANQNNLIVALKNI
jgi:hypothetical protein